jgi:hypothetical protein
MKQFHTGCDDWHQWNCRGVTGIDDLEPVSKSVICGSNFNHHGLAERLKAEASWMIEISPPEQTTVVVDSIVVSPSFSSASLSFQIGSIANGISVSMCQIRNALRHPGRLYSPLIFS